MLTTLLIVRWGCQAARVANNSACKLKRDILLVTSWSQLCCASVSRTGGPQNVCVSLSKDFTQAQANTSRLRHKVDRLKVLCSTNQACHWQVLQGKFYKFYKLFSLSQHCYKRLHRQFLSVRSTTAINL